MKNKALFNNIKFIYSKGNHTPFRMKKCLNFIKQEDIIFFNRIVKKNNSKII